MIYIYCILSCKVYSRFWLSERHFFQNQYHSRIMKPRPNTWWNLASGDIAWRRVIFQNISTAQNLCAYGSPYDRLNLRNTKCKLKHSLDLDCFETKRNVDDVFYWFHMIIYIYITRLYRSWPFNQLISRSLKARHISANTVPCSLLNTKVFSIIDRNSI